jgi:hypothetical protein
VSRRTIEVELDHGRIIVPPGEVLPDTAFCLLTILTAEQDSDSRPIGLAKGMFIVPDDFNAALPDDVLKSFETP